MMRHVEEAFKDYYQERLAAAKDGQAKDCQARAYYDLGLCFSAGQGVLKNNIEAYKYFQLAASCGLKRAEVDCKEMETIMTRSEISEAVKLQQEWQAGLI